MYMYTMSMLQWNRCCFCGKPKLSSMNDGTQTESELSNPAPSPVTVLSSNLNTSAVDISNCCKVDNSPILKCRIIASEKRSKYESFNQSL